METLTENRERCEHPFHCLILTDANYKNPMDADWSWESCTLKCLKCGKELSFYTKRGTFYQNFYREGQIIDTDWIKMGGVVV